MKVKNLIIIGLLSLLLIGATYDNRHWDNRYQVARYDFAQGTWISGVSAALEKTLVVNGRCTQIAVKVNNNDGDKTATVVIKDANGATLFSQAGIAEATTTSFFAESHKDTQDATFNPFLAIGTLTATLTPSGDPSTSGMTIDVYLYVR